MESTSDANEASLRAHRFLIAFLFIPFILSALPLQVRSQNKNGDSALVFDRITGSPGW